jgi:hypothetical protein
MLTRSPPPTQSPLSETEHADVRRGCWSCGRGISVGRGIGADRFCSPACREWFDRGYSLHGEPPRGRGPWRIVAGGDPGYLPGGLSQAQQAGASSVKQRRCGQCQGVIPKFRGVGRAKRAVRKGIRFCSSQCAQQARRREANKGQKGRNGPQCQNPVFEADRVKVRPVNGPLLFDPPNSVGRSRMEGSEP